MSDALLADGLGRSFHRIRHRAGVGGAIIDLVVPRREVVNAVQDVSFAIKAGEVVGYLGPNGAGKSTTIKMLVGILRPDRGRVLVEGHDPHRERLAVAARIGVVFGQRTQLFWDLRLAESFELLRRMYAVPAADYRQRIARLTEALDLGPILSTPVRQLSLGQRMRGEMAAALIHAPSLLLLDEPTIGLDFEVKERLREVVRRLNREHGTTVLLTSHDLDDVAQLCQRLIVIAAGTVVEDGPLAAVTARCAPHRVLVVECVQPPAGFVHPGVVATAVDGHRLSLTFDPAVVTAPALIAAVSAALPIRDLRLEEPGIEDVLKAVYGRGTDSRGISGGNSAGGAGP